MRESGKTHNGDETRNHTIRTPNLIAAMLTGAALCGCGHPAQETAAHKIADALPLVLGPAARYDVQVDGDPFALTRGRARAVHIQGQEVRVSPVITLDTLNADAKEVSFDTKTRRLSHVGPTGFTATMNQTHLTDYLAQSKPLLPGLIVTLRANDVEAQVPVTVLGIRTTANLTGTLTPEADAPGTLDFITNGAQIGFVPLPASLVGLAVERLNPVVDLSGLKVPLVITEAGVENSHINFQGTVDLNGLVQR